MRKLQDRGVEFGQMLLLWNGTFACTCFREIPVFAVFDVFYVSERKNILCIQIQEIRFAFLAIKTRVTSCLWKVVTVSGAGQTCRRDTVSGKTCPVNILILTS